MPAHAYTPCPYTGDVPTLWTHDEHQLALVHPVGIVALVARAELDEPASAGRPGLPILERMLGEDQIRLSITTSFVQRSDLPEVFPRGEVVAEPSQSAGLWADMVVAMLDLFDRDVNTVGFRVAWRRPMQERWVRGPKPAPRVGDRAHAGSWTWQVTEITEPHQQTHLAAELRRQGYDGHTYAARRVLGRGQRADHVALLLRRIDTGDLLVWHRS